VSQPRRTHFSVPAQPLSAAAARHRLVSTLRDWALSVDLDTAQLLLSEVVTNAIRHGIDPTAGDTSITIEFAETRAGLRVEVRDPDQGIAMGSWFVPGDGDLAGLAESGRGLQVVGALAAEWGVLHEPRESVYFVLDFDGDGCHGTSEAGTFPVVAS
jgi:anti-sigma regulatory factor (Ser/Thr protein kinase)